MRRHVTEFLGPIFAKEVNEIARRWRYYMSRTLFAVVLLFVMYVIWERYQVMAFQMGIGNSLARIAGTIFYTTSYVQYWAIYLLAPAYLCAVVAGEREERTLDLLFITPLTDREIVLGKLFSRIAALACLIVCGVPVTSLLMLFGGIGPDSIWRVLAATMLAMLFAGSHAIYFSVIARSPMEAMSRTYAAFLFWLAGLALVAWGCREFYRSGWVTIPLPLVEAVEPLFLAYPLVSFWAAVDETYHATLVFIWGEWVWPISFIAPALWSVLLLWRAVRHLRETPKPRGSWTQWLPWARWSARRAARPHVEAKRRAKAAKTWTGRTIGNPLWLRARLTLVYDRASSIRRLQWLGWAIVALALTIMLIFEPRGLGDEGAAIAFLTPTWAIIALVTALVSGHSLIGDRRRGFLELVALTPLSSRQIIDGTMLALWEHLRRLLWLPVALALFFSWMEATPWHGAALSVGTAILFCTVVAWQGMACSLAAKSTASAVVAAFVMPLIVVFVMPLTAANFRENHGPALWSFIGAWFVITAVWVWHRASAVSVGCFLTGLHLVVVGVAECWTNTESSDGYPMAAMHPMFLMVSTLFKRSIGGRDHFWQQYWVVIILCYWAALLVNIVLLRWWLARRFDGFVGRIDAAGPGTAPSRFGPSESPTVSNSSRIGPDFAGSPMGGSR